MPVGFCQQFGSGEVLGRLSTANGRHQLPVQQPPQPWREAIAIFHLQLLDQFPRPQTFVLGQQPEHNALALPEGEALVGLLQQADNLRLDAIRNADSGDEGNESKLAC